MGTAAGYLIAPHYPFNSFSFRYPQTGIASQPGLAARLLPPAGRGPHPDAAVRLPGGVSKASVYQNGLPLAASVAAGYANFTLSGHAQQTVDWAVSW